MPRKLPSPFKPNGDFEESALKNVIVALVTKLGGSVTVTWQELQETNGQGFYYPFNEKAMVLTVIKPSSYGNA